MAVTHTTLINNVRTYLEASESRTFVLNFFNKLLSAYEWESGSEVVQSSGAENCYGKYYFTTNSYIKIYPVIYDSYSTYYEWKVKIDLVTPNGSKTAYVGGGTDRDDQSYWTLSVGETNKGICICARNHANGKCPSIMAYNLYIGDCTLNGQTVKGCIGVDDSGNLTIATDNGISTETALGTTINADRKAVLVPIANTTTGEIFSDIFVMRYSPIQYNIMDVDGQGIFLCGKALALKD